MWTVRGFSSRERVELILAVVALLPAPAVLMGERIIGQSFSTATRVVPADLAWIAFGASMPLALALALAVLIRRVDSKAGRWGTMAAWMLMSVGWNAIAVTPAAALGSTLATLGGLAWLVFNVVRHRRQATAAFPVSLRAP